MVESAITPTQVVVSVVAVPHQVAVTSVATVTAIMVVVLTTAPRVATSETSSPALSSAANPASTNAKKVAVLMPPVVTTAVVTALSSAAHLHTLGTKATAALPHAKTLARTVHVKAADGKTVAVTTATLPALRHVVQPMTSSPAAPSSLVLATSNPTVRAKAQPSAAAHAC